MNAKTSNMTPKAAKFQRCFFDEAAVNPMTARKIAIPKRYIASSFWLVPRRALARSTFQPQGGQYGFPSRQNLPPPSASRPQRGHWIPLIPNCITLSCGH